VKNERASLMIADSQILDEDEETVNILNTLLSSGYVASVFQGKLRQCFIL
jgi:hypothetical protein